MRCNRALGLSVAIWTLAVLLAVLALGGCGGVGEVGYGASRAGVEPVRGAYGYDSSLSTANAEQQAEQAKSLAKTNQKSGKKVAALVQKIKALPDASSAAVPDVEVQTQPTLEPAAKSVLLQRETAPPPTGSLLAERGE